MRGLVRILAVGGLLWFRTAPSLQAQSVTATLVGTVTDQSGAAVPGAALALTAIGTNVKRTVVTSENGDFTIPGLAPGTYQLVAGCLTVLGMGSRSRNPWLGTRAPSGVTLDF